MPALPRRDGRVAADSFPAGWGCALIGKKLVRTADRCRSSVVEHSLGKGEVESSILSGSTIFFLGFTYLNPDFQLSAGSVDNAPSGRYTTTPASTWAARVGVMAPLFTPIWSMASHSGLSRLQLFCARTRSIASASSGMARSAIRSAG